MKPETPKQRGPIQHTEAFQNASPEAQARALRMQQLSRHAEMRDEYVQTRERVRKAEQHYSALKTEVRRRIDANTSPEDTAHWQKQLVTLEAKYAQLQSLKPAQIHVQPGAPENMGDVSEKEAWLEAWNRIATQLGMLTIEEPLKPSVAPVAAPAPSVAPAPVTAPPPAPSEPPFVPPKASTPKHAPRSAYDLRPAVKPAPAPKAPVSPGKTAATAPATPMPSKSSDPAPSTPEKDEKETIERTIASLEEQIKKMEENIDALTKKGADSAVIREEQNKVQLLRGQVLGEQGKLSKFIDDDKEAWSFEQLKGMKEMKVHGITISFRPGKGAHDSIKMLNSGFNITLGEEWEATLSGGGMDEKALNVMGSELIREGPNSYEFRDFSGRTGGIAFDTDGTGGGVYKKSAFGPPAYLRFRKKEKIIPAASPPKASTPKLAPLEPKLESAEPETKERQAALEQFRKGLHFPQTVGTYPSERFTLEKETDRALCEKDLHALLGAAKGESVERYARKGENFPFGADPKALVRSSEIRYAGEAFTLRSSWRALDDGKSLVKLTIDNAQPGLLMHFDAKGTLTEVTQLRDPFNVWGQIATEKKLEMGRYCKPGKKELQEYYGVRSESERKEKNPPKYDVSKKEDVQKIVFVPTGQALVANLSTPLATDCLWICTGLSVIDPVGKRHMLAHVNGGADATGVGGVDKDALKNAEKALEGFAMATCQVTLAIGDSEENIARELFELLRNKYGVSADRIRIVPPRVIDRGGSHRGEDILCAPGEKTPIFRAMEWSNREGNPVYHHLREQQKSSYEAKAVPAPKDSEPAPAKPDGKADALKTPEEKIFDFNSIESDASFEIVPGAKIKLTEGVSIERNGNKLTFVLGKEWNQDGMLYRHGGTPEGGKPWVKDYAQAFEKYDWLERISFLKVSPEFGKFSIEAMNKTIPSKESMYAIKQGDSLLLSIGENRLRVRTTRPDGLLILAEGSALMAYFGKAKK